MNKIDYLKLCIVNKVVYYTDWWFGVFCVSKTDHEEPKYDYEPFAFPWGYGFYDPQSKELIKIDDAKPNTPMFGHMDPITIDSTWAVNVKQPTQTYVGNVCGNTLVIEYAFGEKYPFPAGPLSIKDVEAVIAPKLTDTPPEGGTRDPSLFYVDENMKFRDALQTLKATSFIFVVSATPKNILAPTGIDAFKKGLDKEYEGRLQDPIVLAEYEAKLKQFDADYMAGDPSFGKGKLVSGKVQNMGRKKLHLTLGQEALRFDDSKAEPTIPTSLREGWPDPNQNPEQYVAIINSMRIGSFARGAETVKGGVDAKTLSRISYQIVDNDCGVPYGITRYYTSTTAKQLEDCYIVAPKGSVLVTKDMVASFVGKEVTTRSPGFCRQPGDYICRVCAGERLFKFKDGMTIPMMEVSSIILGASMAAMHGKVLSVAEIDIERHIS